MSDSYKFLNSRLIINYDMKVNAGFYLWRFRFGCTMKEHGAGNNVLMCVGAGKFLQGKLIWWLF